jgi:hypothetical protein
MKKPRHIYHGSGRELEGDKLIPKKATDLGENPDNILNGIYASDIKNEAIAMGIMSCKGVRSSGLNIKNGKIDAIIFDGWPEQNCFYLYTLPSETFEEKPKGSHQYVSSKPVKPKKIEKLSVNKYIELIRGASEEEKKEWFEKYKHKIGKR